MLSIPLHLPDLWQQDAVRALREGCDVILDAPTGAGKTRVFELFVEKGNAMRGRQAVYTVPTRALANDKWREWKSDGWNVGIATGDIARQLDAPVIVATLETQRERILSNNPPALLVIDEYQLIADARRGLNYELALALPPVETQLLLLSGSVRNPDDIAAWLRRLGRRVELIRVTERPVPLDDFAIVNLPRVPDSIHGFWPRTAAGAMAAHFSPLLIFAPRRKEAEKIARQIAAALPSDDPITLTPEDVRILGSDMARLLQRRVAFHHSGLPYAVRADWVERLGKSGELRVIVATTGLAAGINFSVRSVLVASTQYSDGPFQRELRPDELLQMFGRAGRRGLDDHGTVLYSTGTPRLFDGAPRQVRRVNQLDWPTLLRVMETAAADGGDPIQTASDVLGRLFSTQRAPLGLETTTGDPETRFGPTRREILGPGGQWVEAPEPSEAPLGDCLVLHREKWMRALRVPQIAERFGTGRLCRMPTDRGFAYARDVIVAKRNAGERWVPLPWVRRKLWTNETFDDETFAGTVLPLLAAEWHPAVPLGVVVHGNLLAARLDLRDIRVPAFRMGDQWLFEPPSRIVTVRGGAGYRLANGTEWNPPRGSAAHHWRSLELVDEAGVPTARGRVASRFQGGEGLMIAAALEDARYPVDDLARHLANIRGGFRFGEFEDGESSRLAAVARACFGHRDIEGYLEAGLSPGFGGGTWEAMETYREGGLRAVQTLAPDVSRGDLERASMEWKSLLRHILHCSDPRAPRWEELREAARRVLAD
ncbi:MAG: DEAD/DEAH box helicase [Terrimicrobiaceae bacterium]|nr:DEAD/DEAH box helicase [Terrimicrobiaceae bacterium]